MTEAKVEKKSYTIVAPDDLTVEELKEFYKSSIDIGIAEGGDFHISNSKILSGYFEEKKYPFSFLSDSSPSSGKNIEIIYTRILGKLRRCTCPDQYPLITLTKDDFKKFAFNSNGTDMANFFRAFAKDFANMYDSEESAQQLYSHLASLGTFIGVGAAYISIP